MTTRRVFFISKVYSIVRVKIVNNRQYIGCLPMSFLCTLRMYCVTLQVYSRVRSLDITAMLKCRQIFFLVRRFPIFILFQYFCIYYLDQYIHQSSFSGFPSQDNTGHFGPFQACKYLAYYSFCGQDTAPYKATSESKY